MYRTYLSKQLLAANPGRLGFIHTWHMSNSKNIQQREIEETASHEDASWDALSANRASLTWKVRVTKS